MNPDQITFVVFGILLVLALTFDLGLLSKKNQIITIRQALYQTFFWVALALGFFVFMWIENGQIIAFEYISAYLMEWSLSIDNIFVFILIFTSFSVKAKHIPRVLLIGIMMAIVFRVIFITVGVALVDRFSWVLYLFGAFLVYTGYKMFTSSEDEEFDPHDTKLFKYLNKVLPLAKHDGDGKFSVIENGKKLYTTLFVVVIMLAAIDLVFALDSIPAVMGITRDKIVILRGAVSKFDYLQQGIAIVLVFIGVKMLAEHWISHWIDKQTMVFISLGVILVCISGSIFYSIFINKKGVPEDIKDESVE